MAPLSLLLRRLPLATVIVVLALSATATTARPCRTFLISSYSFRNPSTNTFATITEIRSLTPLYISNHNEPSFISLNDVVFDLPHHHDHPRDKYNLKLDASASLPRAPLGFSTASYDYASLRDRTKDILSVVLALLFGVGCGALTAATMYLVWSVVSGRHDYRASAYDDFSSDDDDSEIESPKKMGYVKIPAAETATVTAAAAVPAPPLPPAKESV